MDLELDGKRVLVTGASRGIGRAIAAGFLQEGARIAICARDEPALAATAEELAPGGDVYHRGADMADPAACANFVRWAAQQLQGLDILVSNVSAMSGHDFSAAFDIDIAGVQALMSTALDLMEDDTDANIVCIGSRAASIGIPKLPAYAAMKAATVSMVKSQALAVAQRGIRVNVVSPGDIAFPGGTWDRAEREHPQYYQRILAQNPLGRLGRPREVADVVTFVASPRASFITGANILVDGGSTPSLQL